MKNDLGAIGGIVGNSDKNTLRRMIDVLGHRGEEIKTICDSNVCFFSRSAPEESWSECFIEGNTLAVFTGEVYNYERSAAKETMKGIVKSLVSNADANVLGLHNLLDGVYAFAFHDSEKRLLGLVRDYGGYCPLYYSVLKDRILFASEIKSILAGLDDTVELDHQVLARYLMYGYCPGLRTLFNGIRRVPPSSVLVFDLKDYSTTLHVYGKLDYTPEFRLTERDFCKLIYETVKKSVHNRTRIGGSPFGVFLSGHLDSSFLAAVLKDVAKENIIAYTAVYSEEESKRSEAQIVADCLGIEHYPVLVKHEDVIPTARKVAYLFDDLIGNPNTLVPGLLLTQEAREKAKSIFTADGSGTLFYDALEVGQGLRIIERMAKIPIDIRRQWSTILRYADMLLRMHIPQDSIKLVARAGVNLEYQIRRYKDLLEASLVDGANKPLVSILKTFASAYFDVEDFPILLHGKMKDPSVSVQEEIQTYFNPEFPDRITEFYSAYEPVLHDSDNGPPFNELLSGYFSIPSRLPIRTNHELSQLAASIPWQLKLPDRSIDRLELSRTKYMLRKTALLYTPLPLRVINMEHKGMSANPITEWLLSDLRDEAESLVFDSIGKLRLDTKYVARIMRKGSGREIRILLMLSLWHKHYEKFLTQ